METDVLSEYDIAGCEPVLSNLSTVIDEGCRGNIVGGSIKEGALFSADILSSQLEGAWFLQINGAIAKACGPGFRISIILGVLVEITEYAEIINNIQCQTSAPDTSICVIMAIDVFSIVSYFASCAVQTAKDYEQLMDDMKINDAINETWALIRRSNKYIDETMPWVLAKDEAKKERLQTVLYNLLEAQRIIAMLVSPIIPNAAAEMWQQLGLGDFASQAHLADGQVWGGYPAGTKVAKGDALFPRYDPKEEIAEAEEYKAAQAAAATACTAAKEPFKDEITIDDFGTMDLRAAKVLACEKIPKTSKLLKFQLDLGVEKRQVVSGIAKYYKPEDLVGHTVIVVTNLKPVVLCGVESKGMILSASDGDDHLQVIFVDGAAPGSRVR